MKKNNVDFNSNNNKKYEREFATSFLVLFVLLFLGYSFLLPNYKTNYDVGQFLVFIFTGGTLFFSLVPLFFNIRVCILCIMNSVKTYLKCVFALLSLIVIICYLILLFMFFVTVCF